MSQLHVPKLPSTTKRVRKKRSSKYAKYDDILGSSDDFTHEIKRGRCKAYEKAEIHSLDEVIASLKATKDQNNLIFDIRATVPYAILGLPCIPSEDQIKSLNQLVVQRISEATGLSFTSQQTNRNQSGRLTYAQYVCKQDIIGVRGSVAKIPVQREFDCGSNIILKHRPLYGYIHIDAIHKLHHTDIETIPMPEGLVAFIEQQRCVRISELFDNISRDPRFSNYYNQTSSAPRNQIRAIWTEHAVSK